MAKNPAQLIKFLGQAWANRSSDSRRNFLKKLLGGSGVMAAGALALPLVPSRARAGNDIDVLNYALTLEHLEYAYYRDGLTIFHRDSFVHYGARGLEAHRAFQLIREHEREHVDTLTQVIKNGGGTPVPECTYDFSQGYQSVDNFVYLAQVFENTGVMAYDGAVALIQNPDLITAGATIATVEARHASYLNLINDTIPFPDSFDTPRTMQDIMDMVAPFIVSCP